MSERFSRVQEAFYHPVGDGVVHTGLRALVAASFEAYAQRYLLDKKKYADTRKVYVQGDDSSHRLCLSIFAQQGHADLQQVNFSGRCDSLSQILPLLRGTLEGEYARKSALSLGLVDPSGSSGSSGSDRLEEKREYGQHSRRSLRYGGRNQGRELKSYARDIARDITIMHDRALFSCTWEGTELMVQRVTLARRTITQRIVEEIRQRITWGMKGRIEEGIEERVHPLLLEEVMKEMELSRIKKSIINQPKKNKGQHLLFALGAADKITLTNSRYADDDPNSDLALEKCVLVKTKNGNYAFDYTAGAVSQASMPLDLFTDVEKLFSLVQYHYTSRSFQGLRIGMEEVSL